MGNNCAGSAPVAVKNDVDKMLEDAMEEEKLNFKILLLGNKCLLQQHQDFRQ
jgi:hypothetical protein